MKCSSIQEQQLAITKQPKQGKAATGKNTLLPSHHRVHRVHTLAGTTGSFELQEDNEHKALREREHVGRHFCHPHSPLQSKKKVKKVNT